MNSKLSMWKLLFSVASVGLLVTNCTLKTDTDANTDTGCTEGHKKPGCICPDKSEGYQVCKDDGTYDACQCTGANVGGSSSVGGASASAGAPSSAGKGGASAGAAPVSDAGAGGDAAVVYNSCADCLADRCQKQYDACDADPTCFSTAADGSGQYERIANCINTERAKGLVKRDVVRGCGVTIGQSPDPDVISAWAPEDMDPVTTDLLNCMADAPGAAAASWANDDKNYPVDGNDMINPTPWPAGTCAKDACTSAE